MITGLGGTGWKGPLRPSGPTSAQAGSPQALSSGLCPDSFKKLHFLTVMLVKDFFFSLGIHFDCNSTEYMQFVLIKMNVGNRRKFCCRAVWGLWGFLKA